MTGAPPPARGGGTLESAGPGAEPLVPAGLDATLVLLRHGETEWILENRFQGQSETPLSAVGLRQASLAADRLARPHASPALPVPQGRPIEVVHSPLARTAETARLVARAIAREGAEVDDADGTDGASGVTLRPEPGIKEIGQGEWEGETHETILRRWGPEISAWRLRPWEAWAPGGESIHQVQARVRPAVTGVLERLGRDFPRGTMDRPQVGGYAGVGPEAGQPWSIVVGHDGVFKILLLTLFDIPLTHFWMFTMALTGITVIEFRGGRPVLRAHNLTEHLAPLLDERAQEAAEQRARTGAL